MVKHLYDYSAVYDRGFCHLPWHPGNLLGPGHGLQRPKALSTGGSALHFRSTREDSEANAPAGTRSQIERIKRVLEFCKTGTHPRVPPGFHSGLEQQHYWRVVVICGAHLSGAVAAWDFFGSVRQT